MRLWIVGKRGLLGQTFCRLCDVRGIDYIATSSEDLNIVDEEAVKRFKGPFTHLINCAAYTAVDQAESDPASAYALNERAVTSLARRAYDEGAKMVHFSTDYVFDGESDRPYTEEDRPDPQTVYGKSKLAGEQSLLALLPGSLILRTSWLFDANSRNFVKTMAGLLNQPQEVRVVDDQTGQPTYAADLVEAALQLRDEEGIYHMSGKGIVTWFGFAQAIAEAMGEKAVAHLVPILTSDYPRPAKRPRFAPFDLERIETKLGRPMPSWKIGLRKTINDTCK